MKLKTLGIIALLLFAACSKRDALNQKIVRVSAPEADAAEPAIAVANNQIFVAWVEHGADKSANVFLKKFDADGQPNGEKVRVNSDEGTATAWRGDPPSIAIGENNLIYLGWTARVSSAGGRDADIMLSVSADNGKSFAAPVKVNDDKAPAVHGMHSLAVDKNGKVYLAWLDERYLKKNAAETQNSLLPADFHYEKAHEEKSSAEKSSAEKPDAAKPMQHLEANREVYFAASTDNGKTFAPNQKLAGNVCPCCKTALLVAPNGQIYASWRQVLDGDFRHIAVAASGDGGETFNGATIVSDDHWQIAGCPVSGASLANGANGALNVLWFTAGGNGTTGIYRAESFDAGKTFAPRQLIGAGAAFGTPVLLSDADQQMFTVWSANNKIFAANSFGDKQTKELGAGELPSAALLFAGKRLAVAFVQNEKAAQRSVWLSLGDI